VANDIPHIPIEIQANAKPWKYNPFECLTASHELRFEPSIETNFEDLSINLDEHRWIYTVY